MRSRRNGITGSYGVLALLVTLNATAGVASEPLTFYGFDEASHSAAANEGLEAIFAGRLFHESIPAAGARMFLGAMNAAQREAGYEAGSVEGRFYASGSLPSPPTRVSGADAAFGLGGSVLMRNETKHMTINCFTCHAGVVSGQVVAGLGNNHINQSEPRNVRTRGDNFGPYGVWQLGARLIDPANKGLEISRETTELEALFDATKLPPVDPMPWWLMKYKTKDYWYADAGPHDAASFSINFTTIHAKMNELHAEHVQTVAKALAFARDTQSPPFPGALDPALVQRGADLFHGRIAPQESAGFRACTSCHGTYTKKLAEADFSQPGSWVVNYRNSHVLRDVKTDVSYNATLQKFRPIAEHFDKLAEYYAAQGVPTELIPHVSVPSTAGYVAPPLVGVWASAPYFHNGSVPTLDTVLNSQQRPEIWSRSNRDPHAYDLERVGMAYQTVSRAEFEASAARAAGKPFTSAPAIKHSVNYDTTEFGHGNMGHTFGDRLTVEERSAIIEFLKSLSGPDMPPAGGGGGDLTASTGGGA